MPNQTTIGNNLSYATNTDKNTIGQCINKKLRRESRLKCLLLIKNSEFKRIENDI
jgi:hypothetical protein